MLRPKTSAAQIVYSHTHLNGHSMLCPYGFYIAFAQTHAKQKNVGAQHAAPVNIRGTHNPQPYTPKHMLRPYAFLQALIIYQLTCYFVSLLFWLESKNRE